MTGRELGPMASGNTPREERLAAAGRVAAGLLHEFRNVLSPISNLAFVLEREADNPERVREVARRLAHLTMARRRVFERLRDFLRQDATRFPEGAVVDLSAAARETVMLCETLSGRLPTARPVRFMCETPRVHLVAGDGGELRTAIFELVLNAMDALPNGGTIRVDTRDEGVRAVLTVQDDGPGPLAGMAETAFDPFISSKEEPDAGLGLSAAWGIARRHDGDLTLGTNDSGGGRAILTLPLLSVDS